MDKGIYYIAITGAVGSGKTTASNIIREYGYEVFDSDLFSRKVLHDEPHAIEVLEKIIGQKVVKEELIDFRKIGRIFDENPLLESHFEKWYQRFLGNKIREEIETLKSEKKIVFFDIPLLQQKSIVNEFNCLWIIKANKNNQFERIKCRNNYSNDKIEHLIQVSTLNESLFSFKHKNIDNNGSIQELRKKISLELKTLFKDV